MAGYRYGNRGVQYTRDGRLSDDVQDFTFPRNADRRYDDFRSYDRDREYRRQRSPDYKPRKPELHRYPSDQYPQRNGNGDNYRNGNGNGYYRNDPRYPSDGDFRGLLPDEEVRRLAGETPWGGFFLLSGALLLLIGIPNAILCMDTHYFCRFWAGLLIVLLGVIGVWHRGDYRSSGKNVGYIFTGLLAHTSVMVSCGILCWKFLPQAATMVHYANNITQYVDILDWDQREWQVNISETHRLWACTGLDSSTFGILLVNFLTLNGVVQLVHDYWDANYKWTGNFKPITRPALFNPALQMNFGQLLMFFGMMGALVLQGREYLGQNYGSYWGGLWAGFVVIVGGGMMCCASKRPDSGSIVGFALFTQVLGFLATTASGVLAAMAIVYDSQQITTFRTEIGVGNLSRQPLMNEHIFNVAILSVTLFLVCLSILFGIWQIFRLIRFLATGPSRKQTPSISDDRSLSVHHKEHIKEKYPYPITDKYPYPSHQRY